MSKARFNLVTIIGSVQMFHLSDERGILMTFDLEWGLIGVEFEVAL